MESFPVLAVAVLVILSYSNSIAIVRASDPDPLQDICVADLKSKGNITNVMLLMSIHVMFEQIMKCSYM